MDDLFANPDAEKWSKAFREHYPECNIPDDLMHGWFANAMMAMHDFLKRPQPLNGDHAQHIIDEEAQTTYKPFDLEAAKRGEKVLFCMNFSDTNACRIYETFFVGVSSLGFPVIEDEKGFPVIARSDYLRMSPTPRKVWRVIYRDADNNAAQRDFGTQKEADEFWSITSPSTSFYFEIEVTS